MADYYISIEEYEAAETELKKCLKFNKRGIEVIGCSCYTKLFVEPEDCSML